MKPHCQYLFFLTCCLYPDLLLILEPSRGSCLGFNKKIMFMLSYSVIDQFISQKISVWILTYLFVFSLTSFCSHSLGFSFCISETRSITIAILRPFLISKIYQNFLLITDGPFVTCSCFRHGLFEVQKFLFYVKQFFKQCWWHEYSILQKVG